MSKKAQRRRKKPAATPPPKTPAPPDPPKTPPGRPTSLTPAIHAVIVEAARKGTPVSFLGPLAGVRRATVFEWIKKGTRPDNPPYTAFTDAIKAAQSAFVANQVDGIATHGNDSWQARAWLLERMFRDEFGGDKLELNQLRKELKELRALVVQVPREVAEEAAARSTGAEKDDCRPAEKPAAEA